MKEGMWEPIKDLGIKNQYDQSAGEGEVVAMEFNDLELGAESKKLALMLEKIPYNSDKFYQVVAQQKKVQEMILKTKERTHEKIDADVWNEFSVWKCDDDTWAVSIGFHRRDREDEKVEIPARVQELLRGKQTYGETDLGAGSKSCNTEYFSENDDMLIRITEILHENQRDHAMTIDIFGFKTEEESRNFFEFNKSKTN